MSDSDSDNGKNQTNTKILEQLSAPIQPPLRLSQTKNKQIRTELFRSWKREKAKQKKKLKKEKKKLIKDGILKEEEKQVPKTIENMRVPDETKVQDSDEELELDEEDDELSSYFKRESSPKILITTGDRPKKRVYVFCKQLMETIPNSVYHYRKGLDLKRIIRQMQKRDFTDLIVVNHDRGQPNGLVISHLPEGPTVHFKLSNVRLREEIKKAGEPTFFKPELVCNNFSTQLGHSICRVLQSLFPHDPQFRGRQVVTFHNQRDFIFFRHHRYMFRNEKKCGLQEIGPKFTMKLRTLQKGTFDSKFGEYIWVHKRHEMDSCRRKFHL